MRKLCYVIPEYSAQSHSHFAYLADFVKELSASFDIFLIIEKGDKPEINLGAKRVSVLWFQFMPLRAIEMKLRLVRARFLGYADFYVHYSFSAAFLSSLIVKIFGGRTFYWNCGLPWRYKKGFLRNSFERLVYRLTTFLVTGTESLKKQYATHYNLPSDKIKVMPNWINLARIMNYESRIKEEEIKNKLGISEDTKIILFVHRLSQRKGAHYLPEIIKQLSSQIPDSKFIIIVIGDGPERKNIELRIKNYELWNKVKFLGWLPNSELSIFFRLADIFILPSEEEGFPHVLLEAMAMRVPFVAFNVGGVSEMTPKELGHHVIPEGNIEKFTAAIQKIFSLPEEQKAWLRELAYRWVTRYDIAQVAKYFETMFD